MTNKIENLPNFLALSSDAAIYRKKPNSQPPVTAAEALESVRLSGEAIDMRKALAGDPRVDNSKVERLRAAIVTGNYRPNPQAIAHGLMEMEGLFGG